MYHIRASEFKGFINNGQRRLCTEYVHMYYYPHKDFLGKDLFPAGPLRFFVCTYSVVTVSVRHILKTINLEQKNVLKVA